jgi:hypothetical protein
MERAWPGLTFKDEYLAKGEEIDPVAPAERSASAKEKAQTSRLPTGQTTHSFKTLLDSLKTIVKNDNYFPGQPRTPSPAPPPPGINSSAPWTSWQQSERSHEAQRLSKPEQAHRDERNAPSAWNARLVV